MKEKLLFIDHSFHKKSKSGDFLRKLLSKKYKIYNAWDESWYGGSRVSVDIINKYDQVFYFQVINTLDEIRKIKAKIIWAPMYDGLESDVFFWKCLSLLNISVISFSKKVTQICDMYSIKGINLKFYIEPKFITNRVNKIKIFFWDRGGISFNDIKSHIDPSQIKEFIIYRLIDPNRTQANIDIVDIGKYKIVEVKPKNFLNKKRYLEYVKKCDIYIAPRKKEGIGMSFLEAMSFGKCIMAYNESTMNEYFTNDSGYLFDDKTGIFDLRKHGVKAKNLKKSYINGYNIWKEESNKIFEYIRGSSNLHSDNGLKWFCYKLLIYLI